MENAKRKEERIHVALPVDGKVGVAAKIIESKFESAS
jgi:hypothetical protein